MLTGAGALVPARADRGEVGLPQGRLEAVVSLIERMNESVNRAMGELAELGGVHPYLLADDTIELRPSPASPELSQKVAEIFERAGVRELRPWVWGVANADKGLSRLRAHRGQFDLGLSAYLFGWGVRVSVSLRLGAKSHRQEDIPAPMLSAR